MTSDKIDIKSLIILVKNRIKHSPNEITFLRPYKREWEISIDDYVDINYIPAIFGTNSSEFVVYLEGLRFTQADVSWWQRRKMFALCNKLVKMFLVKDINKKTDCVQQSCGKLSKDNLI